MGPLAASGSLPVAGRRQRKLRNYLLDAKLQLRLASYLIGVGVALSLGLGWLLWRAYRETSRVIALSDPDSGDSIGLALASEDRVRIPGGHQRGPRDLRVELGERAHRGDPHGGRIVLGHRLPQRRYGRDRAALAEDDGCLRANLERIVVEERVDRRLDRRHGPSRTGQRDQQEQDFDAVRQGVSSRMVKATRRFLARPSAVALEAMGCSKP